MLAASTVTKNLLVIFKPPSPRLERGFFVVIIGLKMNQIFQTIANFKIVQPVQAQTQNWESINGACVVDGVASIQGIGCLLANVLSVALSLLGLTGFVMIIYAAFNWMLSGGKSQEVEKSKNSITYAIIGIILALSSFIIINLIAEFTGISILRQFTIPGSETNW